MNSGNVVANWPAVEAGWLGAEMFVSFDKKAVKVVEAQGQSARPLS